MTNPHETSQETRIVSEYQPPHVPNLVGRWEKRANSAESEQRAQTQLLYHQLLQLRAIKLILLWTLVIVPAAVGIALLILANTDTTTSPYLR